ncbi:hypothetical protein CUZ94_0874 [Enterococcus faecium]|nr:hypothetical protein [Enterococcus faecium]MBK4877326.1 hypothetical protein [Enterococcus faecium]
MMEEFFALKRQVTFIVTLLNQYYSSPIHFVHSDSTRFAQPVLFIISSLRS